jgi:hypothetical protein
MFSFASGCCVAAYCGKISWNKGFILRCQQQQQQEWRRLLQWPFGEEGGVFRFSKAGDALYIVTSLGRWAHV